MGNGVVYEQRQNASAADLPLLNSAADSEVRWVLGIARIKCVSPLGPWTRRNGVLRCDQENLDRAAGVMRTASDVLRVVHHHVRVAPDRKRLNDVRKATQTLTHELRSAIFQATGLFE